jgi:beta-glucosidase
LKDKSRDTDLRIFPFMNKNLNIESRIADLLKRLTLEEKFSLCTGHHHWHTSPIKRLGIKSFALFDGPHGVRPGRNIDLRVTYFPSAICRTSTWNPELSYEFGIAIAQEVRELGGNVLLAPGVNIQRSPMCGRTFEYQTEDPYLNSRLAVSVIKGIQSQRIAACIKHYICNNQETNRKIVNVVVSERALQEIYLPAFKAAVKEGDVWAIMGSYNKINGKYGCAHKELLRDILMDKWGFRGFVVSDWNATDFIKTTEECVHAGLSLEMPRAMIYKRKRLREAFNSGIITETEIDYLIKRLLRIMFLTGLFDSTDLVPLGSRNTPEHQELVRKISEEGIVLLKNERNLLPLDIKKIKNIAILGPNKTIKPSADPDGTSSSSVYPLYEVTPLEGMVNKCKGKINIIESPAEADAVIIFAGLDHKLGMDAEDKDRDSFDLPQKQVKLIKQMVQINDNTIVVLLNGSPVGMKGWIEYTPAIIEAWYPGMEAGNVIADVIFGDINPSGKLPITFPNHLYDSPAHQSQRTFPGNDDVYYDEGIFVGYRYFDKKKLEPLFPFGFGLSYTKFEFKNLVNKTKFTRVDSLIIELDIINIGTYTGAEVIQLYVQDLKSDVERPPKELKGFKKLFLNPNEKAHVNFDLKDIDFAYYDSKRHSWKIEKGYFNLLIGSSSRDIKLDCQIEYIGPTEFVS